MPTAESLEPTEPSRGSRDGDGLTDHFTLSRPSNVVRFRTGGNSARILEVQSSQIVLDADGTIKKFYTSSKGLFVLRGTYTIVAGLWICVFFVFCLQVLVSLVLDLALQSGGTSISNEINWGAIIGVIISIVVLAVSFSSLLVIATQFLIDVWSGHTLFKLFINDVVIDWVFVSFFAIFPFIVMCTTLLLRLDDWWTITVLYWFSTVFVFFAAFAIFITYFEVNAAWRLTSKRERVSGDWARLKILRKCILSTQIHKYSGCQLDTYLSRSVLESDRDFEGRDDSHIIESSRVRQSSMLAKITKWKILSTHGGLGLYKVLDEPTPLSTIDGVRQYRPYVTRKTWNLETIFCRSGGTQYSTILQGPGSITRAQFISTFVCSLIGTILIVLVPLCLLVWFDFSWPVLLVAGIMFAYLAWRTSQSSRRLFRAGKDIIKPNVLSRNRVEPSSAHGSQSDEEEELENPEGGSKPTPDASEALFLISRHRRISQPTEIFCWVLFVLELGLCFIYPVVILFFVGNVGVDILFLIVVGIAMIRHYVSISVVIRETGNLDFVRGGNEWIKKSRISSILGKVSRDSSRNAWALALGFFGIFFLGIFLSAVGEGTKSTYTYSLGLPNDFYYPPRDGGNGLRHPACSIDDMNGGGFGPNGTMADYAFLSLLAYKTDELAEREVNEWFGGDTTAVLDTDTAETFLRVYGYRNTAASFKLFRFPERETGIIAIRGTHTNWDLLADIQLYSAAGLMQIARFLLPLSELWTPVLDELVYFVNSIHSNSLSRVSFYNVTTDFANYLKQDPDLQSVQVTGHSLGGGLSLITGAQARIPAIGISAPNAVISGRSFKPPVYKSELDEFTLNVVPENDLVPKIDDWADRIRRIDCRKDSAPDCHEVGRTLCELQYTCGSGARPAVCLCHTEFGYPKPMTDGDRTFEEACGL